MLPITVAKVAELCGGRVEGDATLELTGVNSLESAGIAELSFVGSAKAAQMAEKSKAACLLVTPDFPSSQRALIRVKDPRAAFAQVITALYPPPQREAGIHSSASVAKSALIASGCTIAARVIIGENCSFGDKVFVGPGCVIGDNVMIGPDTTIHANVTIYDGVRISSRVILHSGCVIGADGFGFALVGDHYEKFPQIGTVEIEEDVEIGANSCVDRAALGVTRIGKGTKLDNMVHVAHNATIGRHVVIAAQSGISGGVTIGDYAVLGGQVGVADKVRIEAKAIIGAQAGIPSSKIIRAGQPVWGTPARPIKEYLEQLAHLAKLPELRAQVKQIELKLSEENKNVS